MSAPSSYLATASNKLWLTVEASRDPLLIHTSLLGLGADHSLLCALPDTHSLHSFKAGMSCKGRFCLENEMYEFDTFIHSVLATPPTLRLQAPETITRQTPRSYPRLAVNIPGVVRPLSKTGRIRAVLPVQLSNLSPTGCQFHLHASAWPFVTSLRVNLNCRLPDSDYHSTFSGLIEWVHPAEELTVGVRFLFQTDHDLAKQDVLRWYTSQQANFVNITA